MKYIYILFLASLFIGCSTVIPSKTEFRVNPNFESNVLETQACKKNSLKVAQAFSSNALLSSNMNYALGDDKQYVYSESLWSNSPNRSITKEYLKLLRDSQLFKSVQISKSRTRNDFILEINIEDFMQYFSEDSSSSYVKVAISLTLIDARTNGVVASEIFKKKMKSETLNAAGGVKALNTTLNGILSESKIWLAKVCK